MSPLLAAIHTAELTTLVPLIVVGGAAVYLLLPRPRPYPWWLGMLLTVAAVLLAGAAILRTGAVTVETFLFYAFSLIAVISGGLLVTQHNPARAALAFAVVILSTCGLFLLLAAPFLAVATIIIYAGAIIVTFLFVLMLAQQSGYSDADARSREPLFSTVTGFILLGALLYVLQVTYVKNDDVEQALDQVLVRTREAQAGGADLNANESFKISQKIKEPLDKILPSDAERSSPRLEQLRKIRAEIENGVGNANSGDQLRAALNQVERKVLYTRQQEGWIQPAVAPSAMSDLSGPSANEPLDNLRYDDQGRPRMAADNSAYLGRSLFTDYLLPVELGGFLLLVAVIGSIAIAHRRGPSLPSERPA